MARANVGDFDVAVLDFSLGSETASPVAHRLVRRGVPFVLCTRAVRPRSEFDRMGLPDRREASLAARASVRPNIRSVEWIL